MPKPSSENDHRPVHTVRHRSLKATIWRNQTDKGVLYNVTVTRSYRERGSEEWRDTHSIGYDDLMNVAALMYEAHAFISALTVKEARKPASRQSAKPSPKRPAPSQAQPEVPF
ncbi:MAG TPA: hypothetical protein VGN88_09030 [Phycisphaerae bacterium]